MREHYRGSFTFRIFIFSLLLHVLRKLFFLFVVTELWSVIVMISLFAMFVTMIYGLRFTKSCRQAESWSCKHVGRSVRHLSR